MTDGTVFTVVTDGTVMTDVTVVTDVMVVTYGTDVLSND